MGVEDKGWTGSDADLSPDVSRRQHWIWTLTCTFELLPSLPADFTFTGVLFSHLGILRQALRRDSKQMGLGSIPVSSTQRRHGIASDVISDFRHSG